MEVSDLSETLTEHQSGILGDKLELAWKDEEKRAFKNKTAPSLRRILFRVFGSNILVLGIALVIIESLK